MHHRPSLLWPSILLASLSGPALASSPGPHSGQVADDTLEVPATLAEVDTFLEGTVLLEPNALWRYFVGTADPAPEFDWGKKGFDDSGWAEGRGPFGYGDDERPLGTRVAEIGEGVSTVYLRRVLEIDERERFERILLEIQIDDAYVLFVRGLEEDRLHTEKFGVVVPFDAHALSKRDLSTPPMPVFDLTPTVKDRETLLAFQTLTHAEDAESYGFWTRVWGQYAVTPEGEAARMAVLRPALEARAETALLAYAEGRHRQRLGDHAGALPFLGEVAQAEPGAELPWARLLESHRALGRVAELETQLRALFEAGARSPAMLDLWARLWLDDLGRSAPALVELLPAGEDYPARGEFADARWAGERLAAGRALRIDCGAEGGQATVDGDGVVWSDDRCHRTGSPEALDGGGVLATARLGERDLDRLDPLYRLPATPGPYELRLTFDDRSAGRGGEGDDGVSEGEATLDVLVEGERALRGFDPVSEAQDGVVLLRLPIYLQDALLDVDLLPQADFLPRLAALELIPIEPERFVELVDLAVADVPAGTAYDLALQAQAQLVSGERDAALATLERAELQPDFSPAQGARLAGLRDAMQPALVSYATVEDLVRRRSAEVPELLRAARAQGGQDELVTYFEALAARAGGGFDEAIGAFELLVADGSMETEAWLGMALCLADADLAEDALGLIAEALDLGVPATPALWQAWISLELGLGVDPWELLPRLRERGVPDELWVVPTSAEAPLTWRYTDIEPPANAWSRPTYEDGHWNEGPSGFGAGHTIGGSARSHWNTEKLFARHPFQVRAGMLLYPHVDVHANDAADVYMNGTRVCRVSVSTRGYTRMPLGKPNLVEGDNNLGLFGFNVRDGCGADVGLLQPIGELAWVADRLAEDGALRINCGGEALTTADGRRWAADRFYGWAYGDSADDPEQAIGETEDDALLRSRRWFYEDAPDAWYQVPLPKGRYRVTLHFAEIEERFFEPGTRTFDVRLEGELVLDDLDVAATVGPNTHLAQSFDTEVKDTYLDVLINDKKKRSFVSALEIERLR